MARSPKNGAGRTRSRVIQGLCGLLAGALIGLWFYLPPPSLGGGKPDSIFAAWARKRIYASIPAWDEEGYTRLTAENANGWYNIFPEPIQSFEYYKSKNPMRPTAARRTLVLQPIGPFTPDQEKLLEQLKEYGEAFFQLPVRIEKPLPLESIAAWSRPGHESTFTPGEGQYNAGEIIDKLLAPRLPGDAAAYLGITMVDLWADDMNFVFGLGSFERRTGVYSLCRYYPEFGGRQSGAGDSEKILRRSCTVLSHETGHMFGLYHCVLYKCCMNGCNSLPEGDSTPAEFCPVCHRKLLWNIGMDGTKQYEDLLAFYKKYNLTAEAKWMEGRLQRWQKMNP